VTGAATPTNTPRTFASKVYAEQPFVLHGLEGISDAQIEEHLTLYAGYVKQVNLLNEELAAMTGRGLAAVKNPEFTDLTRHLGFEYNGMLLHEHYFANLCPAAEPKPAEGSAVATALADSFGSVEQWMAAFQAIGATRAGRLQAAPGDGRVGARVRPRLQGHRARQVHRRLLPEYRLEGRRAPARLSLPRA